MIEAREAVAGKTGWIISDGKTGNDVQTRGVFDALGLNYEVEIGRSQGHLEAALALGSGRSRGAVWHNR